VEAQTIRQGDWSADAASFAITESANELKLFAVQGARSLRRGNQVLFSSDSPASVAANFNANEIEVASTADAPTKVTLFVGKNPIRVLLDGKELSANAFSFNRTASTISLELPGGEHDLKIMFH
jgi:hypothetical protein